MNPPPLPSGSGPTALMRPRFHLFFWNVINRKKTPIIATRDLHLIKTTEKLAYHKELLLIYRDARQTGCRWWKGFQNLNQPGMQLGRCGLFLFSCIFFSCVVYFTNHWYCRQGCAGCTEKTNYYISKDEHGNGSYVLVKDRDTIGFGCVCCHTPTELEFCECKRW